MGREFAGGVLAAKMRRRERAKIAATSIPWTQSLQSTSRGHQAGPQAGHKQSHKQGHKQGWGGTNALFFDCKVGWKDCAFRAMTAAILQRRGKDDRGPGAGLRAS